LIDVTSGAPPGAKTFPVEENPRPCDFAVRRQVRGISNWSKNYRTSIESDDADALARTHPYYDPIDTLPAEGQSWWRGRS
jgi:hypothetical protein